MANYITRRLEFDAGHRILGHESKCAHLHGHRYVANITISTPHLDPLGRVIDFGVVKKVLGRWIDEHWDHNMLLHPDDPLIKRNDLVHHTNERIDAMIHQAFLEDRARIFGNKQPYIFPADTNPTAENIATELFKVSVKELGDFFEVKRVRIYETPNCWADCYGLQ